MQNVIATRCRKNQQEKKSKGIFQRMRTASTATEGGMKKMAPDARTIAEKEEVCWMERGDPFSFLGK